MLYFLLASLQNTLATQMAMVGQGRRSRGRGVQ